MTKKTQNRDKFKERFDYWISKLQPDLSTELLEKNPPKEHWADVYTDCVAGIAVVSVQKNISDDIIEDTALHEALHSMLAPMTILMGLYFSEDSILQKEHAIINRLIKVILNDNR